MFRCPHRRKQIICSRVSGPHCDTCSCSCDYQESVCEVASCPSCSCETTTKIFEPVTSKCTCDCHVWRDECIFCLHSKTPFSYPLRTEQWTKFLNCTNRTYTILRQWFKQFDLNGDGYLDFTELKKLVRNFGPGTLQNSQMKRILNRADIDKDGRLSFVEYLSMWQEAAKDENEFLNVTNCRDLNVIIREYDLFPKETNADELELIFSKHTEKVADIFHDPLNIEPSGCDCGSTGVKLFVDQKGDEEAKMAKIDDENLPVFSSNRSPVGSPYFDEELTTKRFVKDTRNT